MKYDYPCIVTAYEKNNQYESTIYEEPIHRILQHILPPHFFTGEEALHRFHRLLPLISWTPLQEPPFAMKFFFCCRFRSNAFRFFHEMITHWLVPGKRINAHLQFAMDFKLPEMTEHVYTGGEIVLQINNDKEVASLHKNLSILETEIRLGLESEHHANRILEIKGLSADEKTAMVQENVASLVKRRPQDFDYDVYAEMQHFLVVSKEEFKNARSYKHMSRIICTHYLFRKALKLSNETFPERRYVSVKLIRCEIEKEKRKKRVLGVTIGMSFLRAHELFEEQHLLNAIASIVPDVESVEGSFFSHVNRTDFIFTCYLEVKRENGFFSLEEIQLLKQELPSELKNHIEERHHPIFMPQNEEEILRHIVTLNNQLKYVNDIPQAVITFNTQTEHTLEFLVIVLRIMKPQCRPLQELFERKLSAFEYIPDRAKIVGNIRRKHKKEATVFRLRISKNPFLRLNHSVDLYKARQEVVVELTRVLGEFRDFNGGTISKETETFTKLQRLIGKKGNENAFLLEDFFFSLSPAVIRSVLEPAPLKVLFLLLLEAEKEGLSEAQPYVCRIHEDSKYFYMVITAMDPSFHERVLTTIEELKIPSLSLATCFVQSTDFPSFGLVYQTNSSEESLPLRFSIEKAIQQWSVALSY